MPAKAPPRAEDLIAKLRAGELPAVRREVVQVGAYSDPARARAVVERLRKLGFDSYLSDKQAEGRYRHRVRVRPDAGRHVASLAQDLEQRGFKVWVTAE